MAYFELTDETLELGARVLHRIRATTDIAGHIRRGELGGWVESPQNLTGAAWVAEEAKVYGNA